MTEQDISSLVDLRTEPGRVATQPSPSFPDDLERYRRAVARAAMFAAIAAEHAGYPAMVTIFHNQAVTLSGFEAVLDRMLGANEDGEHT